MVFISPFLLNVISPTVHIGIPKYMYKMQSLVYVENPYLKIVMKAFMTLFQSEWKMKSNPLKKSTKYDDTPSYVLYYMMCTFSVVYSYQYI